MRILLNAALAFGFVLCVSGLVPVSALTRVRLTEMKSELATAQEPSPVRLRASIPQ